MKANSGISVGQLSGSDATNGLHTTIKELNEQSQKQTRQMLRLTWAIAALTAVMLVAVIVQVYLAWPK